MAETVFPRREAAEAALLVPLCAGLAGGALHVLWYLADRYALHRLGFNGSDTLWMAPVSYVLLLALPGILFLVLLMLSPRPVVWRIMVFICSWIALFSAGLLLPELRTSALFVLTIGVASAVTVAVGPSPERRIPLLRRFAAFMLGLTALGAFYARGIPPLAERWQLAHLSAAQAGAPNVLFLVIDTQRAENLSLYGYMLPTSPHLDSLARESTVFDWAISPAPWTLPSHASMFSGRPAGQLSARWFRPFDDPVPRVAEVLRDHGYVTAAFSANFTYAGRTTGLERGFSYFLRRPFDFVRLVRFAPPWQTTLGIRVWQAPAWPEMWDAMRRPVLAWNYFPAGRYWSSEGITTHFLRWQSAHAGRPFFAFLNFLDVHEHHRPGSIPPEVPEVTPTMEGYDDATVYVDSVIHALQDTLATRGLLDHTLIIVTADHGEQFGEHGVNGHGHSLYMPVVRVPLLLRYPGVVPAGMRVSTTVSTRDLAATIEDLTGVGGHRLPGVSLAETWRHPAAPREPALSEVERDATPRSTAPSAKGPMRALVDQTWHYISGPEGEELYRYRDDPREQLDLSRDPRNAEVLARMRMLLRHIPFRY